MRHDVSSKHLSLGQGGIQYNSCTMEESIRPTNDRNTIPILRLILGTFIVAVACQPYLIIHQRFTLGITMVDPETTTQHEYYAAMQNNGHDIKPWSLEEQHHHRSVFVPMSAISEVERQVLPGIFNYGQQFSTKENTSSPPSASALIITGASISGDYHYPKSTLWFQIFVSARKFLEATDSMNDACYSRDEKMQKEDVKHWDEVINETFLCRIGKRDAYFELMSSNGIDANTNELIQVWRCPLYNGVSNQANILSEYDFQTFHDREVGMALPIEILHRRENEFQDINITPVVKIHLPTFEPNIGINQLRSDLSPGQPFLNQRHNITLCVVSHVNAITHWNEYIRYHHDIVGIDHIHMALYTTFGKGQKEKANRMYTVINRNFNQDIVEGRLSVSALWDEDFDIHCPDQEFPKINFYQQCLYRAKSTSEFVATWDLDEYFLFHNLDASDEHQNLPNFLRGIERPQCQDWCFVTMKSSLAGFDGSSDGTGLVAFDYSRRTKDLDSTWAKSISRTKNVFLNSYHIPGACLPPGAKGLTNTYAIDPSDGECGFYIDEAITVHVRGMQYGEHELQDEETVPNELLNAVLSEK